MICVTVKDPGLGPPYFVEQFILHAEQQHEFDDPAHIKAARCEIIKRLGQSGIRAGMIDRISIWSEVGHLLATVVIHRESKVAA